MQVWREGGASGLDPLKGQKVKRGDVASFLHVNCRTVKKHSTRTTAHNQKKHNSHGEGGDRKKRSRCVDRSHVHMRVFACVSSEQTGSENEECCNFFSCSIHRSGLVFSPVEFTEQSSLSICLEIARACYTCWNEKT